ncbi:hypothetical protein CSPX01_13562 [Colletotrichum filicis]|nr:hypothetical protein CSPX01_13562 [Colletotrichum filicis]
MYTLPLTLGRSAVIIHKAAETSTHRVATRSEDEGSLKGPDQSCFEGSFAAPTPSSPPVTLSKAWCSWDILGLGEADQRPDQKVLSTSL